MKNLIILLLIGISIPMMAQDIPLMDGVVNNQRKGDIQFEKQAYVKALNAWEKALENDTQNKDLLLKIAKANQLLGHDKEAEEYYRLGGVAEASLQDRQDYMEVLAHNGKHEEAVQWANQFDDMGQSPNDRLRTEGFSKQGLFREDSMAYRVKLAAMNSPEPDFSPAFIPEGLIFVSGRKSQKFTFIDKRAESAFLNLYLWENEAMIPFHPFNTPLNQGPVSMMGNKKLAVTTNQSESVKNADRNKATHLRLDFYEKTEDLWVKTEDFPFNSEEYSLGHPAFDSLNNYLYFASNMQGGFGGVDIYRSQLKNGQWGAPENMGPTINTEKDEMFPFVDMTNHQLYFASDGHPGLGGLDIFKVNLNGTGQTINLGYPVNSPADDFGLILDKSGNEGYLSSNRTGGIGKDDIYTISIHRVNIRTKLLDHQTGKPIAGDVRVINTATGKTVPYSVEDDMIIFEGIEGQDYSISGQTEGYLDGQINVVADGQSGEKAVVLALAPEEKPKYNLLTVENKTGDLYYAFSSDTLFSLVQPLDKYKKAHTIQKIYFDLNSAEVASETPLEIFSGLIQSNPTLGVEIRAHADSRGSKSYNEALTARRAQSVADYLIGQGISAKNIRLSAMGENDLVNQCTDDEECTESEHAENRRVEFRFEYHPEKQKPEAPLDQSIVKN